MLAIILSVLSSCSRVGIGAMKTDILALKLFYYSNMILIVTIVTTVLLLNKLISELIVVRIVHLLLILGVARLEVISEDYRER